MFFNVLENRIIYKFPYKLGNSINYLTDNRNYFCFVGLQIISLQIVILIFVIR